MLLSRERSTLFSVVVSVVWGGAMTDRRYGHRNAALAGILEILGYSASRLVDEVNQEMGAGYVLRSAASEWIDHFRVPPQPLPTVIAHVLSQALGAPVSVSYLWPDEASASTRWVASDKDMQVPWDLTGMKALVNSWLPKGEAVLGMERRSFMAVSGAALTAPAWQYVQHLHSEVPPVGVFDQVLGAAHSRTKVSPATVEYFGSVIGALRRADDVEGGSEENLKYAGGAVSQVVDYLNNATFTESAVARNMLGVLAQLSQISGWMAYDAERHGLAQRYFRIGLHAAHSQGDHELGAHILASMSDQAACRNQPGEAVELAEAAVKAANRAHPLVRAVVTARLANAQAAGADVYGFHCRSDEAMKLLGQAHIAGGGPQYLYWFTPAMAEAFQGWALLLLARRQQRSPQSQLDQTQRLLAPVRTGADNPRDAFFLGAWLARAYVKHGDLYESLRVADTIVDRIPSMASTRTRKVLRGLDNDLANLHSGQDLPGVRTLRKQLQPAFTS